MSKHLQRDLEHLKKEILSMGSLVEGEINKATKGLVDRRLELAAEVIAAHDMIDQKEIAIEEDCLKILALHQPVARDLRIVIAIMKVNNDLERMGDLAVNIAERATYLASREPIGLPLDFGQMVEATRTMVRESLDSLVNLDTALARQVCAQDDEVDAMNREMYKGLQDLMRDQPKSIKRAVHTLSASRHLERIADLATNIAEDVVFLVEGEVIRHGYEDYRTD